MEKQHQEELGPGVSSRRRWFGGIGWKILCSPLPWIVVISLLVLWKDGTPTYVAPDSPDYLNYRVNILAGETDVFRTPVYPWFIRITQWFACGEDRLTCIVVGQILVFELSVICFYLAGREWIRSRVLLVLCTLLYATRYEVALWCFSILTEVTSAALVVFFYYAMVIYIKRPSAWKAAGIGVLSLVMVMERPVFIYTLALLLAFWCLRCLLCAPTRRCEWVGLMATLVAVGVTLGYCQLNARNHGVFAPSSVTYINQLDQIIDMELYRNGADAAIDQLIAEHLQDPEEAARYGHPRVMLDIRQRYGLAGMKAYTTQTLRMNRGEFLENVWQRIKHQVADFHFKLYYFIFLFGLLANCVLWGYFRQVPWLHWGVWGMVAGMLAAVFWGSPGEYGRLMTPVFPLSLAFVFRVADAFWQKLRLDKDAFTEYLRSGL